MAKAELTFHLQAGRLRDSTVQSIISYHRTLCTFQGKTIFLYCLSSVNKGTNNVAT
jgi:hypothetical protein